MERREAKRSGGARPPAEDPNATIKGALIIAAAIVLGFVLLTSGFNSDGDSAAIAVTTTTVPSAADRNAPPPTTTPSQSTVITAPPITRASSELTLIVSNGSGKSGVAGTFSTKLKDKGYTVKDTANAAVTSTSNVFYIDGAEGDAAAVAEALGWPATAAVAMPSPAPVGGKSMNGIDLVVVVGSDQG